MKLINAPRAGASRRSFAALLAILVLLSSSCANKMAVMSRPAALSGGGGGGVYRAESQIRLPESVALASNGAPDALDTRKFVRNGSLDLLVNDVGQSTTKIGSIVTGVGGFLEKSTQTNSGGHSASVTVRVPAARLDPVIVQIKALATTVDRESVEARDVTREYIDLDARLRNAQAEEAQYLQILKRATTIKDTLDVTEKLADVRGRVEQMQGEMKFLTAQIEMSTLEIQLRAEADAAVAGIHWRPLRQAKIAASEMVAGLADWVDSVVAFFINLPLIAVWFLSIVVLVVVVVRVLRFFWRRFGPKGWRLPWRRSVPPVSTPVQG
jgi:uncharacterized protein DUF4349